jgi:RNA polymerase sigma-70 factor (ECF subfamily)
MVKDSQKEIFIQAFGDYEQKLLLRSFAKIGDRDLADDLVQTTFLKTWQYLIKSGDIDSMKSFLFHVLNGLIIDEYRKKKTVSLDLLTENGFEIAFDDSDRLINTLDGKTALIMIPLLEKKYRKVITMRYLEEKTISEIAKKTQQSKNTVCVQIHRGVDKLALLIRQDEEGRDKR